MNKRYFAGAMAAVTAAFIAVAVSNQEPESSAPQQHSVLKQPPILSEEMKKKINDFIDKYPPILKSFTSDGIPKSSFSNIILYHNNLLNKDREIPVSDMDLFVTSLNNHEMNLRTRDFVKEKIDMMCGEGFFDGLQIECWNRLGIENPAEPKKFKPYEQPTVLEDAVTQAGEEIKYLIDKGKSFIFD